MSVRVIRTYNGPGTFMSPGSQGLLGPQDACLDYHGMYYWGTLYGKVSTYIMLQ